MRPHRILILSCIFALAPLAHAVTVYGPQGRNTAVPTGTVASAGWQWEGQFGSFLGTAISSHFFIAAQHIGGSTGTTFNYNGTSYAIDSSYDGGLGYTNITGTDLRIWRVTNALPSYAPLYGGASLSFGSEVGKNMFVVGRGLQRGEPLTLANARLLSGDGTSSLPTPAAQPASALPSSSATALKGWLWGPGDAVQSWGTNVVSNTATDPTLGKFITFAFDASGGPNEAILAPGDSSGGVFVDVTGAGDWRLAGVNYGVDANFKGSASGATFSGSLFDEGGLWNAGYNPALFIPDQAEDVPANSYSSSISANYDMIQSILAAGGSLPDAVSLPEPGSAAILIIILAAGMRRSKRESTSL